MGRVGTRWVALAALVLCLAAVAATVLIGRAGVERDVRAPGAATGPEGSTSGDRARDRAIKEVLDRRAQAVLDRDREMFLADVERADPDFLAAQEQLFRNLAQVQFSSWEYELIGRDYDRPDLADTYDRPYHLPALLLHYAIEGFDVDPVARPQVLTFVRSGQRWLVASDSDADSDLPETGHADPWDRRRMVTAEGRTVLLLADAEDRRRVDELVDAAEDAVRRVREMWPDGWRRRVVVVAVRDQRLIETYFRTPLQTSEGVAAIAVPAFDVVPGWSTQEAAVAEQSNGPRGRVILNPRYFDANDEDNVDLLTHEVAHVATQSRTLPGAPEWLAEGAAEYTAYRNLRPFSVNLPAALRRQVREGSVTLPTYDFYQRQVGANYIAGFLACAYVAEEYGESALRRLYRRLAGTPREIQTLERQDEVLEDMFGLSTEEFSRQVAGYAGEVARNV